MKQQIIEVKNKKPLNLHKIHIMFILNLHKIVIPFFMVFFLLITLSAFSLHAEGELTKGKPALPGETCRTEPLERWTPQEKWVWNRCAVHTKKRKK